MEPSLEAVFQKMDTIIVITLSLFTLIYISWVIQDEWHVVFCGARLPTKLFFFNENSKDPRWHSEFWFTTPTLSNTPPRHNHCRSDWRITSEGYKCLTCLGRKWWKQKHNETGLERIPIEGEGCILKWNTMVIVFVITSKRKARFEWMMLPIPKNRSRKDVDWPLILGWWGEPPDLVYFCFNLQHRLWTTLFTLHIVIVIVL